MRDRQENWESALVAELRAANGRPYDARRWNCARFAHQCANAIATRPIPWITRDGLVEGANAVLTRIDPAGAQRGDVVLAHVPQPSLGICLGVRAAFVTASGLMTIPRSDIVAAWSV